ncbi:hypothetical protein ACIBG7_04350 [Nonomuraea sp. NPDC050328]|uniref:hypothetical protein n=1 Tax=Nonomuraea sp. NPDC050328 TaxID=3364361 RepID=UPI0037AC35C2
MALLGLIASLVLASPSAACACKCVPFTLATGVQNPVIFSGTVTTSRLTGNRVVVTLAVDRVYKGKPGRTARVTTATESAACGFSFAKDRRYLVFATEQDGLLATTSCAGTRRIKPGPGLVPAGAAFGDPFREQELLAALGPAASGTERPETPAKPTSSTERPAEMATTSPVAASSGTGTTPAVVGGAALLLALGLLLVLRLRRNRSE